MNKTITEVYETEDLLIYAYKSITGRRVRIYKLVKEFNIDGD